MLKLTTQFAAAIAFLVVCFAVALIDVLHNGRNAVDWLDDQP